jgi:glycosyltransferase involved in cell wall biosynthesis
MRVLHVATPSAVGGLERVVASLAEAQQAQGDDVHVATLTGAPEGAQFLGTLALHNIDTHAGSASGRDYWQQRADIGRLGRRLRPDVVHTHGYHADVVAAPSCHRTGAAVVTTLHGFTGGGVKNRCYEWLQRRAVRECDGIVAVSQAMAEELTRTGLSTDQLHVIPNILPPPGPRLFRGAARRSLGVAAERFVVGWVGRLSHEKGLDLLLDALALAEDDEIDLAVLGDGPERQRLMRQARTLGIDPRVVWCGTVPGADRFFPAFDLLVLSSRTEGSPIVLLEAMSACVPIVATEVGGVPETVSPSTALLVPPEDPVALATAIRTVRKDGAGAARRSLRAHVRSARISDPRSWAAKYARVYDAAKTRRGRVA